MITLLISSLLLISILFLIYTNAGNIPSTKEQLQKFWNKKVVVITGGASGIGRDICIRLTSMGSHVIVFDLHEGPLKILEEEILGSKGSITTMAVDVSDRQQVYHAMKRAHSLAGKLNNMNKPSIDIMIANAGIVFGKSLEDLDDEHIERTIGVNLLSHFWLAKACLPQMKARGEGHLVFVSSVAGLVGMNNLSDYCASKFGSFGFAESLRRELYFTNIKVTTICPWAVSTGMFGGMGRVVMPMITSSHVADSVVNGILWGNRVICIPWFMRYSSLSHLLPEPFMDMIAYITNAMDAGTSIVGRGTDYNMKKIEPLSNRPPPIELD